MASFSVTTTRGNTPSRLPHAFGDRDDDRCRPGASVAGRARNPAENEGMPPSRGYPVGPHHDAARRDDRQDADTLRGIPRITVRILDDQWPERQCL